MADIVTLQDVKRYVEIRTADDDPKVEALITQISGFVENVWCQRRIAKATYADKRFRGTGTDELVLPELPVISVTKLILEKDGTEYGTADEGSIYEVDREAGIIMLIGQFAAAIFPIRSTLTNVANPLGVTVSWTAGYIVDGSAPGANEVAIPEDLRLSVIKAVAFEWKKLSSRAVGVLTQALGTENAVEYIRKAYPPDITMTWDIYKRVATS